MNSLEILLNLFAIPGIMNSSCIPVNTHIIIVPLSAFVTSLSSWPISSHLVSSYCVSRCWEIQNICNSKQPIPRAPKHTFSSASSLLPMLSSLCSALNTVLCEMFWWNNRNALLIYRLSCKML